MVGMESGPAHGCTRLTYVNDLLPPLLLFVIPAWNLKYVMEISGCFKIANSNQSTNFGPSVVRIIYNGLGMETENPKILHFLRPGN